MATNPASGPVVLDGIVSDEKLAELLALGTEYPELDFKERIDPSSSKDIVELALDVGAMQVRGGYIVIGVDSHGVPTGRLGGVDMELFDEARLVPKLQRYLPEPLNLHTNVLDRDGSPIALVYVGPHPAGCAFFRTLGQYEDSGQQVIKFRPGDVSWRNGTRTERLSQQGFEDVIARRLAGERQDWLAEHQQLQRAEMARLQEAYASQQAARAPLGRVNVDLDSSEIVAAVLELARGSDEVAFRFFLDDTFRRARVSLAAGRLEPELADILDKLACLAAALAQFGRREWFERVVDVMGAIFAMAFGDETHEEFGMAPRLDPTAVGPRVWLMVIERVFGIGAFAVREQDWEAVRYLASLSPEAIGDYYGNWLRFGLTMASRAEHLRRHEGGQVKEISVLSLARSHVERLECMQPDGVADEALLSSLVQFDALANVIAVVTTADTNGRTFYPSWARFRDDRVYPIIERLLRDDSMRHRLLDDADDSDIARAVQLIGRLAGSIGIHFGGFRTWDWSPQIKAFLDSHGH